MVPPPLDEVVCGLGGGGEVVYNFAPITALLTTLEEQKIVEGVLGLITKLQGERKEVT